MVGHVSAGASPGCMTNSRTMRIALLAVIAVGCGGGHRASHTSLPAVAKEFPATRWVPAKATYVLSSPTVKQAQRSMRDVIDSLGILAGVDVDQASRAFQQVLAVDALSPDPVAGMGIDLEGGIAMFSEAVSPTVVVHLSAPDQTQAFFDRLRERGLVTRSVIVDGSEIFSAALPGSNMKVSWAVAADWLWVHVSLPFAHEDPTAWFAASHTPGAAGWTTDWQWAEQAAGQARSAVVGFVDAHDLIGTLAGRVPEAVACARLLEPIGRVGLAIDGDGQGASGRLTVDLGPAAQRLAAAVLPVPEGWAEAVAHAPLAVQMNLDLVAVRTYLAPCTRVLGDPFRELDRYGVRAGRMVLLGLDPDGKTGSGAAVADLATKRWFADKLDDIPLRSHLESDRTFGALRGHSLSVPFGPTVDYVLTDLVAMAAVGDGLLARLVGKGGAVPGPVAAVDVQPGGLSEEAWLTVLDVLDVGRSKRFVERLMRWRQGHISIAVSGTTLVLAATGRRR